MLHRSKYRAIDLEVAEITLAVQHERIVDAVPHFTTNYIPLCVCHIPVCANKQMAYRYVLYTKYNIPLRRDKYHYINYISAIPFTACRIQNALRWCTNAKWLT